MKKIIFLTLTSFVLILQSGNAQTQIDEITYSYDFSGNRTGRTIIINSNNKSATVSDTTQTAEESEEQKAKKEYTDVFGEQKISVFPVPTEGILNIQLIGFKDTVTRFYKIIDMNGKVIRESNFTSDETSMNISSVPQGMYFLILKADDKSTTWKIIKQ